MPLTEDQPGQLLHKTHSSPTGTSSQSSCSGHGTTSHRYLTCHHLPSDKIRDLPFPLHQSGRAPEERGPEMLPGTDSGCQDRKRESVWCHPSLIKSLSCAGKRAGRWSATVNESHCFLSPAVGHPRMEHFPCMTSSNPHDLPVRLVGTNTALFYREEN